MIEHFKKKFEEKTDQELLHILDHKSSYQDDALEAAKSILEWRKQEGIEVVSKPVANDNISDEPNPVLSYLNPRLFIKSFNKKDLFTSFSTAFIWVAVQHIFNLYGDEPYFKHLNLGFTLLLLILILITNHIIYKMDHQRSNNYAGRVLQSVITVICFIIITSIINSLRELKLSFFLDSDNIANLIALLCFILFVEILIGLLKRFFKFIKWEIL